MALLGWSPVTNEDVDKENISKSEIFSPEELIGLVIDIYYVLCINI